MIVKITQSPHLTWYNTEIGKEFKVLDTKLHDDIHGPYIITTSGGIFCADYVIVNKYPTIKSEYFD